MSKKTPYNLREIIAMIMGGVLVWITQNPATLIIVIIVYTFIWIIIDAIDKGEENKQKG